MVSSLNTGCTWVQGAKPGVCIWGWALGCGKQWRTQPPASQGATLWPHLTWFFLTYFIEVQLIHSTVCISAVQQSDSVIHTHMYSFSYSFPLWFITGYWIPFPVLYSRTLLFIQPVYKSLPLLTPNSQCIPALLSSPLATTSLFSVSGSLFLFCRYVHLCHILDSTYKW